MRVIRPALADAAFAAVVMALGLAILVAAFWIDSGSGYDRIGPRVFPFFVAAGLLVTGAGMLAEAVLRGRQSPRPRLDRRALGLLAAALGLGVLLLERAGFVITATLLFWLVARAFHGHRSWRDAGLGLGLAVFVYWCFTRGLGLPLPAGILGGLS